MSGAQPSLTVDQLRADLKHHAFRAATEDLVGVEVEWTVLGADQGRFDPVRTRRLVQDSWRTLPDAGDPTRRPWNHGDSRGDLTLEPGGQIEFSSAPYPNPEAAADATCRAARSLSEWVRQHDADGLIAIGYHPWSTPEELGLHTDAVRYRAMQRNFDRYGPFGRRMMRLTGSVQVNIDFGEPTVAARRWELALRLGPILTATFANGAVAMGTPVEDHASLRARAWLELDPSRSGIPSRFLDDPESDPIEHYLDFAMRASVFQMQRDGGDPEQADTPLDYPSLSFADWMSGGLPEVGYPTLEDWRTHLSTLFPETRPRGFLEIRSIDAPGMAWTAVPVHIVSTVLRNAWARDEMLERLRPHHRQLDALRRRAMQFGLKDPTLAALARELFEVVTPHLTGESEALVRLYRERYLEAEQSPGHELAGWIGSGERLEVDDLLDLENHRCEAVRKLATPDLAIPCGSS